MKYIILLTTSFLFLTGSFLAACFFWDVDGDWRLTVLLLTCPAFFLYLFIQYILNYSKIQLEKNELRVSKAFTYRTYDLSELTSWIEETNTYRVSYRKLELIFPQNKLTLFNHADPLKFEELFHFLRKGYKNRRLK
jgi:hypothetical protein